MSFRPQGTIFLKEFIKHDISFIWLLNLPIMIKTLKSETFCHNMSLHLVCYYQWDICLDVQIIDHFTIIPLVNKTLCE